MIEREPFLGSRRGLVLAIDIGTTYSGISYSILDPGAVPEIKGVTRFPAQASAGGSSKIPSVLYYDSAGSVRLIGAETLLEVNLAKAEDEQWIKVEWFKLRLKPNTIPNGDGILPPLPPLPPNKSIVDIFADLLQYLFRCSKTFIQETVLPDGPAFWASVENDIQFVLSHPNGWEGAQQTHMRRAAVLAGLVSNDRDDQDRIQFVTEGEASLHFCINSGLMIKENEGVIIVDCGGGTIDISAYAFPDFEESFDEISRPECCLSGSIFVTEEARKYFQEKLQGSRFSDDVPTITACFDQSTKLQFRDKSEPSYVKFGGLRDRDPTLNIQRGQLTIEGSVVARFFEPSVKSILKTVVKQRRDTPKAITSVFLVGGFAASTWLFNKLKEDLQHLGLSVHRPDTHINKAVSDGAVSFFLDHFVAKRVSRSSYGIESQLYYNEHDAEHRRRGYIVDSSSGRHMVPKGFKVILRKDTQVSEEQEFRESFFMCQQEPAHLRYISINILKYQGDDQQPSWIDRDSEMYSTVCTVIADTSAISLLRLVNQKTALTYYQMDFDVLLLFGLTELKAQIAWKENGVEKRSRAEVVYEIVGY